MELVVATAALGADQSSVAPRRLAVIDLGSNSFRLVVFTAAVEAGWWKRTDEIYEPVRIGEGLGSADTLRPAAMDRALATIDVFAHFCRASALEGDAVDAVATSAIRDARNAHEFLAQARERSDLPIRVLSREEEARYGYLAAVNSTTLADGFVLDLGGGSLQLVGVRGRLETESGSWSLGAVRMTERFLAGKGPAKRRQLDDLRGHVRETLADAPWLARGGRRLIGVGGTVRNLAAAVQRAAGLPSLGVQGQLITRAALDELIERLAALPAADRGTVSGIKPARADLILAGAVVIASVLELGDFDAIEATEAGLREGVFFESHLADHDPPLFPDVRQASVRNLAAQYHADGPHTAHVAALALGLFDDLAAVGLHGGDPIERELLQAACALHDIGMSVDYDDHHKHTRYLILNAGLPGFSPREVALIAQAARYHRKGMPDPGPLASLFTDGDEQRLDRCAVLLRLAEGLERSRDQIVREVRVRRDGDTVQLQLTADGEVAVPRWAASRETELFERAFGARLRVA
jgi:exopolyphosphatase/guanosine-5'-triphosphate,3'-diphosphate pyrophosphatase